MAIFALQEEVLRAIIQSGDKLTAEEEKFMNQISAKNSSFVQVADNAGISP
jgi:predicted DNA-binding ArsR family transcriptional regulator